MPASWRTLCELTKVETKALEAAIKDGRVNPKMQLALPAVAGAFFNCDI